MCRPVATNGVFLTGMHTLNHIPTSKWQGVPPSCSYCITDTVHSDNTWLVVFPITWHTSESILLQHVSREALAPERAGRVDTSVVADVAFINQALIRVLPLNRALHCISPILLLTNGEGLSGVRTIRYYSTQTQHL